MKTERFNLYEIKHFGDEMNAVSELKRIGCARIRVIARDNGAIRIACQIPDEMTLADLYKATNLTF